MYVRLDCRCGCVVQEGRLTKLTLIQAVLRTCAKPQLGPELLCGAPQIGIRLAPRTELQSRLQNQGCMPISIIDIVFFYIYRYKKKKRKENHTRLENMADVHYQGFVPHRPPVPMVRSMSFNGLPTGHGVWHTPASPLDIPGAALPHRSRRLPYLLSVSVPDNADAVLSRSLLEQCRLDSISDNSPRSSSLKQYGSWASKVFSEVASSNKASLSTCASSNNLEEATEAQSGVQGTDTTFTKKKYTERRPELQDSALSAALRGSYLEKEGSKASDQIEGVRTPSRDAHEGNQRQFKTLQSDQDDRHIARTSPRETVPGDQVVPILIPSNQRSSPATSSTGSSSSAETWSDWSGLSSPGSTSHSYQRRALLDRLMEYCYAILANNDTEVKGDASTSYAQSSTCSPSQGSAGQNTETPGQYSSHGRSNKKRSSHKESDASGDSEDDGDKGLGSKRVKTEENMGKRLACPFFKRNPQRYLEERSCVGPGWRTVHRLKWVDTSIP